MGSTRLPGKSMMPLAGQPMLARILERVVRADRIDETVVAIPDGAADDVLAGVARGYGLSVFRGSEADVLDRHYQAALQHHADQVVRIPADNPVPDPVHVDLTIAHHIASGADFTSTYSEQIDNGYISGLGCEVYRFETIERAWRETSEPRYREHPHTYVYDHPERFKIETVQFPMELRRPGLVLDVNTLEEYRFMARLYDDLYPQDPNFAAREIVSWYDRQSVNADV